MGPENHSDITDTEYRYWLSQAAQSTNKALTLLAASNGPDRSYLYRFLLGRASSILSGLYVQEKQREMNGDYVSSE
jgi:hypothetical protein